MALKFDDVGQAVRHYYVLWRSHEKKAFELEQEREKMSEAAKYNKLKYESLANVMAAFGHGDEYDAIFKQLRKEEEKQDGA